MQHISLDIWPSSQYSILFHHFTNLSNISVEFPTQVKLLQRSKWIFDESKGSNVNGLFYRGNLITGNIYDEDSIFPSKSSSISFK